jgi:hypothetical protein
VGITNLELTRKNGVSKGGDSFMCNGVAYAAEYINDIGQAVQAAGGRLPARWFQGLLHLLKHQGPAQVLRHLNWLAARYRSPLLQEKLTYLLKREAHMQYPAYQEAGWPIGSGSVGEWGKR